MNIQTLIDSYIEKETSYRVNNAVSNFFVGDASYEFPMGFSVTPTTDQVVAITEYIEKQVQDEVVRTVMELLRGRKDSSVR